MQLQNQLQTQCSGAQCNQAVRRQGVEGCIFLTYHPSVVMSPDAWYTDVQGVGGLVRPHGVHAARAGEVLEFAGLHLKQWKE
jgi:hypothetical protein